MRDQTLYESERHMDTNLIHQHLTLELSERIAEEWAKGSPQGDDLKEGLIEFILLLRSMPFPSDDKIIRWAEKAADERLDFARSPSLEISEFNRFKRIFMDNVKETLPDEFVGSPGFLVWLIGTIQTFDMVTDEFLKTFETHSDRILSGQQELINELSSPIIEVAPQVGILPLIGDIDTHRAKSILTHSLQDSLKKELDFLFIDLSGVAIVDTMVAQQLFRIISALNLIGVDVILSGIRPEVAQTAIQMGIDFSSLEVKPTIAIALQEMGFTFVHKETEIL
ncbi:STAS domain-containing protein [Rossellomorea sp. FS2]|nr:STAS domain-containing protein [Rossellomorea marisflavi]USK94233.1 STAS domain-containing protein [Rossellomorea marisflavi]